MTCGECKARSCDQQIVTNNRLREDEDLKVRGFNYTGNKFNVFFSFRLAFPVKFENKILQVMLLELCLEHEYFYVGVGVGCSI